MKRLPLTRLHRLESMRTFNRFRRFLRRTWPTSRPVRIVVKYDHIAIAFENGSWGFGAYVPKRDLIYVGGRPPVATTSRKAEMKSVLTTLAHEYYHHVQRCSGRRYDERTARRFAVRAVEAFTL